MANKSNLLPAGCRAALFDADGTLLSFTTHTIPESTKAALRALRNKGLEVVLVTGRPPYQLDELDLSLFSAAIVFNGQLSYRVDGTPLVKRPIAHDAVERAVAFAQRDEHAWMFMDEQRCYVSRATDALHELEQKIARTYPVSDITAALDHDIYQLNVFAPPAFDERVVREVGKVTTTRWSDVFCDVLPEGGGKAPAALALLGELGIPAEQTVAFGDGGNDAEMLSVVGCGVAMGNASPEAIAAADMVTDDCDHDGIWNACVALGLIDAQ